MRRRQFITLVGSAPAIWPWAVLAEQVERVWRIGSLGQLPENDPELRKRQAAFLQTLQKLGWRDGQNVRIDHRYALGHADNARRYAAELMELAPDVILAEGGSSTGPLLNASRTVPIVFVLAPDPVGAGFVESLSHPGGNATGFSQAEYATSGKWLELLKDLAPRVTRVLVLRDLAIASGIGQFGAIQAAAASLGVEVSPLSLRDAAEMERGIGAFAASPNGGLIVTGSPMGPIHRDLIIALAARHQLPVVYPERLFPASGGLISYGPDFVEQYRQAAGYVDRILKGEKPGNLPVQQPTKFELVINLKTAKALGIDVPAMLMARADEGHRMKRRRFAALAAASAAATLIRPRMSPAQQAQRRQRIGVLMSNPEGDPEVAARAKALEQGLFKLGLSQERNLTIDYRLGVVKQTLVVYLETTAN